MFFHRRKGDLIRRFFRRRGVATSGLRYLDVGCGKGELLSCFNRISSRQRAAMFPWR